MKVNWALEVRHQTISIGYLANYRTYAEALKKYAQRIKESQPHLLTMNMNANGPGDTKFNHVNGIATTPAVTLYTNSADSIDQKPTVDMKPPITPVPQTQQQQQANTNMKPNSNANNSSSNNAQQTSSTTVKTNANEPSAIDTKPQQQQSQTSTAPTPTSAAPQQSAGGLNTPSSAGGVMSHTHAKRKANDMGTDGTSGGQKRPNRKRGRTGGG